MNNKQQDCASLSLRLVSLMESLIEVAMAAHYRFLSAQWKVD